MGDGTTNSSTVPVYIDNGFTQIAAGRTHSMALRGTVLYAWGGNYYGQLGDGVFNSSRKTPFKILSDVAEISAGVNHSAAVTRDGSLYVWGYNNKGQIGDGTVSTTLKAGEPIKVAEDIVSVSAGEQHTAAAKEDGTLLTWGYNGSYQLGTGDNTARSLPVAIWSQGGTGSGTGSGAGGTVMVSSDKSGADINLSDETISLPSGFNVAAYSIDGGSKWKKGALPSGDRFKKLFDKQMTLWLVNEIDARGKPEEGAEIIKFPTINMKPKANAEKLKPYYLTDTWVLAKSKDTSGTAVYVGYEYAETKDKKTPSGEWKPIPDTGFDIKTGKEKTTYLVRASATASAGVYTAAGKQFKITPANYGKATKYKVDYKKELLKLKKGDRYSVDGGKSWAEVEESNFSLSVSDYISSETTLIVYKGATGKKPRTENQTIEPLTRLVLDTGTLACSGGRITENMKKYEVYNPDRKKWGSVPKPKTSDEYLIRLKTTAKRTAGNAASVNGTLRVIYGEYSESKEGIVSAEITMSKGSSLLSHDY